MTSNLNDTLVVLFLKEAGEGAALDKTPKQHSSNTPKPKPQNAALLAALLYACRSRVPLVNLTQQSHLAALTSAAELLRFPFKPVPPRSL